VTRVVFLIALVLAAAACGGKPRPEAKPAPIAPTAPPPKPLTPPPEPEATAEQLPLEDDFAPQAEQEITAANYRAALDAIEKEMAAGGK
jgi:hypothetical protein